MKKYIQILLTVFFTSCTSSTIYYKNSDFADDWERYQIDRTIGNCNVIFCSSYYRPPLNRAEFLQFLEDQLRADSCSEERIDSLKHYKFNAEEIYHQMYGTEQVFHIYNKRITNRRQEKESYLFYYNERFLSEVLDKCDGEWALTHFYKCAATDKNQNHISQKSPQLNIKALYPKVIDIIMKSQRAQQYAIVPPEPEDEAFGHTILHYQYGKPLMDFAHNCDMTDSTSVKIEQLLKSWCEDNELVEIYLPVNRQW